LIHRARNIFAKVPKNALGDVKADYWAIFDVPDEIEAGLDAVAYVQKRIDAVAARWRDSYPVDRQLQP
jgi:transposase-like protein